MTRVLVTDASYKNALAAIRCLGCHGVAVTAAASRRFAQGSFSRFAEASVVYPRPTDEQRFVDSIVHAVDAGRIDVVLPIGGETTRVLSKHKARIERHAALPVADWEAMQVASDKGRTMALAARIGVPVPRTFAASDEVDRFPIVVKAARGSGDVRYVNSREELESIDTSGAVLQEYVAGTGYGFFALFVDGEERATFMHRRLREYPVTGGASTAAESFYDGELRELGLRLLDALHWHGVAMVEFKRDRTDGQYKLMEINPKFWGSLDLAIAAGVEFPWLAVQAALERELVPSITYPTGVRFRWVFDDFLRTLAEPRSARAFLADFSPAVHDDLVWSDPMPLLVQAGVTFATSASRIATRRLRRPHGSPRAQPPAI